jgi:heme/copper-type cytochrome/quinol oxidase subunit 4
MATDSHAARCSTRKLVGFVVIDVILGLLAFGLVITSLATGYGWLGTLPILAIVAVVMVLPPRLPQSIAALRERRDGEQ